MSPHLDQFSKFGDEISPAKDLKAEAECGVAWTAWPGDFYSFNAFILRPLWCPNCQAYAFFHPSVMLGMKGFLLEVAG
jgi:hypothetical protein